MKQLDVFCEDICYFDEKLLTVAESSNRKYHGVREKQGFGESYPGGDGYRISAASLAILTM